MAEPVFKIAVVGDSGVGKTSIIERLSNFHSCQKYSIPGYGDVNIFQFHTNYGDICFDVTDFSGREEELLKDDAHLEADGALMVFSVIESYTYDSIHFWGALIRNVAPDIPTVLCGNKVDAMYREVEYNMVNYPADFGLTYYEISTRSDYQLDKPFIDLARQLTGHDDLWFFNSQGMPMHC